MVGLLLIVGVAGGAFTRALLRGDDGRQDTIARLYRMEVAAAEIGAAQVAYVAPGQHDEPWLQRVGELVQRLEGDALGLQAAIQSPDAAIPLQEMAASLRNLAQADSRIRDHLMNGEELSAADLIFTDARTALASFTSSIRRLEETERAVVIVSRKYLTGLGWTLLGAVSLLGVVGLVVTMQAPSAGAVHPRTALASSPEPEPTVGHLNLRKPLIGPSSTPEAVDLQAAADVCTAISRIMSNDALPDLLARTAVVLDATGIIVWMGAGEELFAAASHGYDPGVLARLGPIGRHADNATAAAWRSGELNTVPGSPASNGALVAPILGVDRCIGALSTELRHGRESDPATRAVTTVIAAQLASVISAWPAASAAPLAREEAAS